MKSNRKIIMSAFTLFLAAISLAGCAKVAREPETTTAPETTTEEQTTDPTTEPTTHGQHRAGGRVGADHKDDLSARRGNDPPGFRFFKYRVKDYGISGRF